MPESKRKGGHIRKPSFRPCIWETLEKWDEDRLQDHPGNTGDIERYDNDREARGLGGGDVTP